MPFDKSLKREILVWFFAYSILLFSEFIYSLLHKYAIYILPGQILGLLYILTASITLLLPIFHIGILGFIVSFFTLVLAHQLLNLRGWKLIRLYMLPHPLIVSLFLASLAYFYHKTDTSWWGWLIEGVIAYFLLIAAAYIISKLLMRLESRQD